MTAKLTKEMVEQALREESEESCAYYGYFQDSGGGEIVFDGDINLERLTDKLNALLAGEAPK